MNRKINAANTVGVVLAGGQARRMNYQCKPLLLLNGQPLIARVIASAKQQVSQLIISTNSDTREYQSLGLPLVADTIQPFAGPLIGVYSAMIWYQQNQQAPLSYLAVFPGDVPIFPKDIVTQLSDALMKSTEDIAWCESDGQAQPLFSLWSLSLLVKLRDAINSGMHGPQQFFHQNASLKVHIPSRNPGDFLNINTPEDLLAAEAIC